MRITVGGEGRIPYPRMSRRRPGRPRIIHCADYGNQHPGSFAPMVSSVLALAQESGWQTELLVDSRARGARWLEALQESGTLVHYARTEATRAQISRDLRRIVGEREVPTVLHTHFTRFDIPAAVAAARRPWVGVVWHEHTYLKRRAWILARNTARMIAFGRGADLILCAAPDTARAVRARGAPSGRVVYLGNGIDVKRFSAPGEADVGAARRRFGLPEEGRTLLHFGWTWHTKGGDLFLASLAALRERFPDLIGVDVIGAGQTAEEARRLGVSDILRTVPATEHVDELMAATDCLAAVSRAEGGTPFTVLEALASGVGVVASDIPGHVEIGAGTQACRIVPLETNAIVDAIATTLSRSPEERLAEGRAARKHIASRFSLESWSEAVMGHYEGLLSRRSAERLSGAFRRVSAQEKRVIQLCDFRRREGGSFIPSVLATLRAAREAGWAAEAVFVRPPGPVDWEEDFHAEGFPVSFVPPDSRWNLGRWLTAHIDGRGESILHSHFTTWDVPASMASFRKRGVKSIWHVHSTLPDSAYSRARNLAKFATLGRAAGAFLCPSQNIIDGVLERGGPRGKVLLWPSAIDTDTVPIQGPDERVAARRELGLPDGVPVVLHFGWHWHLKGGDVFVSVVKGLVDSGLTDMVALERGGDESRYLGLAERLGVADRLRIVPPVPDVGLLFAAADVLVTSSRSEGMAYSVVESLASGTPVVATPIPGHVQLGGALDACRLAGHDADSLVQGVLETLGRSEEVATTEAADARRWIERNLSVRSNAVRLIDLYESILEGAPLDSPELAS